MRSDKKSRGTRQHFVLLTEVGNATVSEAPDDSVLRDAYLEVSA
jgi:3-dehydroquinate synthetase